MGGAAAAAGACGYVRGRAVQVDPIKSVWKAPGTKRSKLRCDAPLSNFALSFNLRRYNAAGRYGHVMFPENAHEPALQAAQGQGLTLVHFSAQREHFFSHVSGCFAGFDDKNGSG